ncbi:MAG: alpha-glucan family phosphorylase [bacterium]|nr:alpha-glucan family phosphorylase [bacterium]
MNLLGRVSVFPSLPAPLNRLERLAHNLMWAWAPDTQALFRDIAPEIWDRVQRNPVKLLCEVPQSRLDELAVDPVFLARYQAVLTAFDAYMDAQDTWFRKSHPDHDGRPVAYFSAEFGLHESLPIYSGGLGILAGDHCKSASDIGLPFVGVGLLYNQGYFRQQLSTEGRQEAMYDKLNFNELPIEPALGPDGEPVFIHVSLPGRRVWAKVWQVRVGRVSLYLLDTDIDRNSQDDRRFSAQLYGGDHDMRIAQEIILGIGGVRALRALGIEPAIWHMNEGHSAFLGLERIRELVQGHELSFYHAIEAVAASSVFTTHTPVPAGNDAFSFEMMERYFRGMWSELRCSREEFLELARQDRIGGPALFSMTVLALRLSRRANGVSKLHGEVSRDLWKNLWPGVPVHEVPITSITNGIHPDTWLAPDLARLFDERSPSWREDLMAARPMEGVPAVPAEAYWQVRRELKVKMIAHVRDRVRKMRLRHGEGAARVAEVDSLLDPDTLTIGFARRFATYKRATMLFRDLERLKAIVLNSERPVQVIFAGKSHPADEPGKKFIQAIHEFTRVEGLSHRIVLVEDYDMHLARDLVRGVDVWLNNPRRPLEASGTSGQKAALNGVLNFSVLDGWWCEGYNGKNGWSIGEEREFRSHDDQDDADSMSLYHTLESEIVPMYYDRDASGLSARWVAASLEAIRSCGTLFSTHRMVQDYTNFLYVPAHEHGKKLTADGFSLARLLADWKGMLRLNWHHISIEARGPREQRATVGDTIPLEARLRLGGLDPRHFVVEICQGREFQGALNDIEVVTMGDPERIGEGVWAYSGGLTPRTGGSYSYAVRVRPHHPELLDRHEVGLIRWA